VIKIIIKQTRINNAKCFAIAQDNEPISIRVENVNRFKNQLRKFGFEDSDESGTSILPCSINKYAKKNAELFFKKNKNLPKESYTQVVYWTRYEWAGRGKLNPVTEFSYIERKRYHRDYFEPYSVYFTLITDTDKPYIISDAIPYVKENHEKLVNTVNMLLGIFGECTINFTKEENNIKKIMVNWDILPKGKYPWENIKETLKNFSKGHSKSRIELMIRNSELIYAKKPDFVAYGRAGFKGYVVFGFSDKNLYILESVMPNNATYVLQNDWEHISQLTKAEILSQRLHKARIIHSKNWEKDFDKIMEQ
jgi:hypothetical protein